MINVLNDSKITIQALKAADNETLTGEGVDMLGYGSVTFVVGALKGEALDFSIKAQQDSASTFAAAADLLGTAKAFSTTIAADGQAEVEVVHPQERYVRPLITVPNATAATPVFCIAIQTDPKYAPVTNTNAEIHVSPAEGTA